MTDSLRSLLRPTIGALFFALILTTTALPEDEGATVYKAKCVVCHGANGGGKPGAAAKMEMPDLRSAAVQKLSDDQLFESIALGKGHKVYPHTFLYKGLNEGQIHGLVRHLRELARAKDDAHKTQPKP